jgi:hypothetical protein
MEELRNRGRDLRQRLDNDLQGDVYTAMMVVNEAERNKVMAEQKLESRIISRRKLRLDRYSTDEQLLAANAKVKSAVRKLNDAKAVRLEAEKQRNEADNALALGSSELRGIEIAMDRCLAELKGIPYHDPNLGLSTDPTSQLQ